MQIHVNHSVVYGLISNPFDANALLRHAALYKDQNQIHMSEHGFLACIAPWKELDTKQSLYQSKQDYIVQLLQQLP